MTNLLKETIKKLTDYDKTPEDVRWVGGEDFWFTWEEFQAAANVEYDQGFGAQKVATDLVIVGEDWWLERGEYDGSEGWDFKTMPERPQARTKPRMVAITLKSGRIGWETLAELQGIPRDQGPQNPF